MNKEQEELIERAFLHIYDVLSNREPSYTAVCENASLEPKLRKEMGNKIADAFNLVLESV